MDNKHKFVCTLIIDADSDLEAEQRLEALLENIRYVMRKAPFSCEIKQGLDLENEND